MQPPARDSRWTRTWRWLIRQARLDHDYPMPHMGPDEMIILEGSAAFTRGLPGGGRVGKIVLTNQRLIGTRTRCCDLIDQGAFIDLIAEDRGLRLRLRSARHRRHWPRYRRFWVEDLNEWVAAVKDAVASADQRFSASTDPTGL